MQLSPVSREKKKKTQTNKTNNEKLYKSSRFHDERGHFFFFKFRLNQAKKSKCTPWALSPISTRAKHKSIKIEWMNNHKKKWKI